MHRRFRIGPPKMHRRFRIGPLESVLALRNPYWPSWIRIGPPEMPRRGILMYPVYYVRKALKKPIWNRMGTTQWVGPVDNRPSTAEALPIGKIQPFRKIAITLEPVMRFWCPTRFRIFKKNGKINYLITESTIFNQKDMAAPKGIFTKDDQLNQLINYKGVCRTAPAILGLLITRKDNTGSITSRNWEWLFYDSSQDILWNIAWALRKSLGLRLRDLPRAPAIFHRISLLSS